MRKRHLLLLFCIIVTLLSSSFQLFAASEDGYGALGVGGGDYYYVKSNYSNLYLTLNSTSSNAIQKYFTGLSNQQFILDYQGSGYYVIRPRISTSTVLGVYSANSNTNGALISAGTNQGYNHQKWSIKRNTNGTYKLLIASSNNSKGLAITNNSSSSGATLNIWTYSSTYCDWILEPAYIGTSSYFLTANDVSANGMNAINSIKNSLSRMGYSNSYTYLPYPSSVYSNLPNKRLTIIHGHGSPGVVACKQANGSTYSLYSSKYNPGYNNASISNYSYNKLGKEQFIMYIACHSGAAPSGGQSMVDATYNKGASYVMGFKNGVAGGEYYAKYLFSYLENNKTISTSINNANYDFQRVYSGVDWSLSPANSSNRCSRGYSNKRLKLN